MFGARLYRCIVFAETNPNALHQSRLMDSDLGPYQLVADKVSKNLGAAAADTEYPCCQLLLQESTGAGICC